jgi:hypothetical protein
MGKYISWTKGGNIYQTYYFIWIGKLCVTINIRKKVGMFTKIRRYFNSERSITINI